MRRCLVAVSSFALALSWALAPPAAAAPVRWSVNDHLYDAVLVSQGLGWIDAQSAVEARGCGWYLATITSASEDKFVFGLIKNKTAFFVRGNGPWLGGFQKSSRNEPGGNWAWISGEAFTYTNWAPGEPSNRTAGHQDAEPGVPAGQYESFLSHKANGLWNDHHPNALFHGYVAEFDTVRQTACRTRG